MTGLGIGLLLAGVVLLVAEAHIAAGGVLGAVGIAAAVAGTALAVDGAGGGLALALALALVVAVVSGTALLAAARAIERSKPRRVRSGREALVGAPGVAREAFAHGEGRVLVEGAVWAARVRDPADGVDAGERIVVERLDGLTLTVRRAEPWELLP
jgi:membrane protein implicated in regulation of membrane protease activity